MCKIEKNVFSFWGACILDENNVGAETDEDNVGAKFY